jgi:hypothetical protein
MCPIQFQSRLMFLDPRNGTLEVEAIPRITERRERATVEPPTVAPVPLAAIFGLGQHTEPRVPRAAELTALKPRGKVESLCIRRMQKANLAETKSGTLKSLALGSVPGACLNMPATQPPRGISTHMPH